MSTELTPLETAFRAAFANLACEFLAACNYRMTHYEYHAFNRRLDTTRSVPEYPADWARWWLAQSQEHIGVYRPQDHDPKQDSVSEVLNGVILHIAQTAVWPDDWARTKQPGNTTAWPPTPSPASWTPPASATRETWAFWNTPPGCAGNRTGRAFRRSIAPRN